MLNADDPLTVAMAERSEGEPFYFTFDLRNPVVQAHVRRGGRAIVLEEGLNGRDADPVRTQPAHSAALVPPHLIPATLVENMDVNAQKVLGILTTTALADALDLSKEDPRVVARYGEEQRRISAGRCSAHD